jgi:hypothetical protein
MRVHAAVKKRRSTGLHRGMFDEDVRFEFNVKIDSSKRGHFEEMLHLFENMSSSFKEVWQKKLESLK